MKGKRVRSKRTSKVGWRFRYTDPVDGTRRRYIVWLAKEHDADKAFGVFMEGRERVRLGLPDNSGWSTPYAKIVDRFITEGDISTERRRSRLRLVLEANPLKLRVGADLANSGRLTAECRRLIAAGKITANYATESLQAPLKQLAGWAANVGLFPYDPLARWKRLPTVASAKRPSFEPEHMPAILDAARDYDALFNHAHRSDVVILALLVLGNRPSAVFAADVQSFDGERVRLSPGNGKKRNGKAATGTFGVELREYLGKRTAGPLLLSHEGSRIHRINIGKYFTRCMTLAFTRLCWPALKDAAELRGLDAEQVKDLQFEVAHLIYAGRHRGFDGAPPRDKAKLARRAEKVRVVNELAERLSPAVAELLHKRDMYALRKTHRTWAKALGVDSFAIDLQIGHSPRGSGDRDYTDTGFLNPDKSAQAVWDVLNGVKTLPGRAAVQWRPMAKATKPKNSGHAQATNEKTAPVWSVSAGGSGVAQVVVLNGSSENGAGEPFRSEYTTLPRLDTTSKVRLPKYLNGVFSS